jgi:branched-chain amino acid transport system substrate-binding protein
MRAWTVVALVAALTIALAACGGSSSDSSEETAESPATTSAPADTGASDTGAVAANTGAEAAATGAEAAGEPITIGSAVALTGFFNAYDLPQNAMMEFAISDVNDAGGVNGSPLEIIYEDTKSDVNLGANAVLELIDQGAEFITVSPDYDFGRAAATTAQENGKVVIGAAGSAKFGVQGIGPLAFNVGISSNTEGAIMAEFSYEQQGYTSPFVLLDDTIDYDKQTCEAFTTRWNELAGEGSIVGEDIFKNGDASISAQITRIKSADPQPDFIVLCSYNPGAASAIRQIRAAGIDLPIVASASMDGAYWLEAIPNLNDFYYVAYASLFGDDPEPLVNELVERYTAQEGQAPSQSTSIVGYRQIQVLTEGIKRAGSTDSEAVASALETLTDFPTVLGPITYTEDVHFTVEAPMRMMQIVDGKQSFLELWDPESVPPVQF